MAKSHSNATAPKPLQPVAVPSPATPVRSLDDAPRLLETAARALRGLASGDVLWFQRRVGDDLRREKMELIDGAPVLTVPSLRLQFRQTGVTCTVGRADRGPNTAGLRAVCKDMEAAGLAIMAATWAAMAHASARLHDVRVEAVELTRSELPRLRLSSRSARARWWLEFDARGERLVAMIAFAGGVEARFTLLGGTRGRLTVDGQNAGDVDLAPVDSGVFGDRARLLEVPLNANAPGDPLDTARQRLKAMARARGWWVAGPAGIRFRWLAGKLSVKSAVLPVLGAIDGSPGVIEANLNAPTRGGERIISVTGRELGRALTAASVPDGCWIGLVLGARADGKKGGVITLLPCGSGI